MVIDNNLRATIHEAVAVIVSELLSRYVDADCAAESALFYTTSITIVDLRNVVGSDLMLLLAPLISAVHDCVGEEADGLLEEVKAAAGDEVAAKNFGGAGQRSGCDKACVDKIPAGEVT
jgi:hypothetical protein